MTEINDGGKIPAIEALARSSFRVRRAYRTMLTAKMEGEKDLEAQYADEYGQALIEAAQERHKLASKLKRFAEENPESRLRVLHSSITMGLCGVYYSLLYAKHYQEQMKGKIPTQLPKFKMRDREI